MRMASFVLNAMIARKVVKKLIIAASKVTCPLSLERDLYPARFDVIGWLDELSLEVFSQFMKWSPWGVVEISIASILADGFPIGLIIWVGYLLRLAFQTCLRIAAPISGSLIS